MVKCSHQDGGHDIPSAVRLPDHRWRHDLPNRTGRTCPFPPRRRVLMSLRRRLLLSLKQLVVHPVVRAGGRAARQWRMHHDLSDRFVHVRGATEHNLKNIDADLPRDAMVAFTGVSGSGKSSLAFGTLYAEAQRRYFESVAPYARRLLQQVGAPHVQEIPELPLDRGHPDHTVQPGADALLARWHLPGRCVAAGGGGVLSQHCSWSVSALPRAG